MMRKATIVIDKEKNKSDTYVFGLIIINYVMVFFFFRLVAIMMTVVLPMSILFIYGIYKIISNYLDKIKDRAEKVLFILLGFFYCVSSSFTLYLIFSRPHITLTHLIHIFSYIGLIFGFAGVFKAIIYRSYKSIFRLLNLILGILTIIFCVFLFITTEILYVYSLFSILFLIFLNSVSRSMLYLSKYEISIINLRKKAILKFLYNLIRESPVIEVDVS